MTVKINKINMPPIGEMSYRKGVNAVLMNSENEILIVQKVSYKENEWDIPGGGLEDGESLEEGIRRELLEELGISNIQIVGLSQYINKFEWPIDVIERGFHKRNIWYRGQEKFQIVIKFLGLKSEIHIQKDEIRNIKWMSPKNLKNYLIFPNQFEVVEKVLTEFSIV